MQKRLIFLIIHCKIKYLFTFAPLNADVAELVDALDLGSSAYGVGVRVPSSAQGTVDLPFVVSVGGFDFDKSDLNYIQ